MTWESRFFSSNPNQEADDEPSNIRQLRVFIRQFSYLPVNPVICQLEVGSVENQRSAGVSRRLDPAKKGDKFFIDLHP
ncbi:hypothetical protein P8C59_004447 [Phyllachora maydis]|uniref:Uncharacterized protein n=1 Tax=Phyllachora maydis TaxID=1825666 RepID=A0AAD9I2A6_9PEZI|nr:hypothetical protein P8C59_004447 [Phyllachora maydis]